MGIDDIVVEIHHGENFRDGDSVEYVGGWMFGTQQSNMDPISSSINDDEGCWQKGGVDESTSTIGSQNSRGSRVKHTPTKSLITQTPTPIPTSTSVNTHIPSPTITTQKTQSHDTTPVFNENNEHIPQWDWEDPRPESPILWDKLIEGNSLSEEIGDSEYVPETEVDSEAFEDIGAARAKVAECKKQKVSRRTGTAEQVGKQDMAAAKSTTAGIQQTHLGSTFHSDYETSKVEMDTAGETDEDVPTLLRKKDQPIKVDEYIDYEKLKWQVGMTFGTIQGFKDAISRFAIAQGYDLKISISDSRRKKGCRFKVYASCDKSKATWVVRIVNNHHVYTRNMVKNRQLKYPWIASHYLLRFKENPTWSTKELVNAVKKDHGVEINKWTAYKVKQAAYGMLHDSMFDHYLKLGRYIEELNRSNPGSSRPKRNRRKDRHEDPKKTGRLTRHGRQIVCTNCKSAGHNKKGCPQPAQSTHANPPPQKRQRDRLRKQVELLGKPWEQEVGASRGRGESRGRRGSERATRDTPSSSGPQSMINQGQPLIFSQASVAISSSYPFVSPL
ncbi:hypothetical protein Cgig2_020012 [Carnegiea gigantea]|uniref:Transposase MuDR plant domain-containing protein n=1 Tax=Carnegiea gigantea TaxID=171969 RepID=A0A9Q1QFY6_9CARY|nr:hypothetical protein Cgig2_020012 [Carnegiea gigantea]